MSPEWFAESSRQLVLEFPHHLVVEMSVIYLQLVKKQYFCSQVFAFAISPDKNLQLWRKRTWLCKVLPHLMCP